VNELQQWEAPAEGNLSDGAVWSLAGILVRWRKCSSSLESWRRIEDLIKETNDLRVVEKINITKFFLACVKLESSSRTLGHILKLPTDTEDF